MGRDGHGPKRPKDKLNTSPEFAIAALWLLSAGAFALLHGALDAVRRGALLITLEHDLQSLAGRLQRHLPALLALATVGKVACGAGFLITLVDAAAGPSEGGWGRVLAAGCGGALLLVLLTETLPPVVARRHGLGILRWGLPPAAALRRILFPLLWMIQGVHGACLRILRVEDEGGTPSDLAEDILEVVHETERTEELAEAEREMIEGVVELRDADVAEIMTDRTRVVAVPLETSVRQALETAEEAGHARLPVYEERLDQVVGIILVRDLVGRIVRGDIDLDTTTVGQVMREPLFVPESKRVYDLLQEFRVGAMHMAVVLDEYGGTAGIVTAEDILEEIVGEIIDEFDEAPVEPVRHVAEGVVEVEASARVDDINKALGTRIPEDEDFDTVGGFACSEMGRVPAAGEFFSWNGLHVEVLKADERHVLELRLTVQAAP